MKIRGQRECTNCGRTWSYYDTGSIECPDCGSAQSVGTDERTAHTDAPAEFDLTPVRTEVDDDTAALAGAAAASAREYVRKRGFIHNGTLKPLDETFVAAMVLRAVGDELARALRPTDDAELYFLALLADADSGDRPPAEEVPPSLRETYGLGIARAVEAYQRDLRTVLTEADEVDSFAVQLNGRIRDWRKRIEALDGDVDPADADRLVYAARDVGTYLEGGDESTLVTAENWLDGLGTATEE
jgi:predicted  nucleic acid-binding Zn-ribbon protein